MGQQLSLFEPVEPSPSQYEIFFVIQPDPATAQRIYELAAGWRLEFGLTGKLRPPEILHVSLPWPFDPNSQNQDSLVTNASKACEKAAAETSAFEVKFDQVSGYRQPGKASLALSAGTGDNTELRGLHQRLTVELMWAFSNLSRKVPFNPHVTLLYDHRIAPTKPIPSVSWIADEVKLVASELGETKYHVLGRWPLG